MRDWHRETGQGLSLYRGSPEREDSSSAQWVGCGGPGAKAEGWTECFAVPILLRTMHNVSALPGEGYSPLRGPQHHKPLFKAWLCLPQTKIFFLTFAFSTPGTASVSSSIPTSPTKSLPPSKNRPPKGDRGLLHHSFAHPHACASTGRLPAELPVT